MASVRLSDQDGYRVYIHATVGMVSLVDAAHSQAHGLETTHQGKIDWADIVALWDDLGETSRVLERLWTHLERGGYLPSYQLPPAEPSRPAADRGSQAKAT